MAHRGVGDQFLKVGLDDRHHRAIDDADHRQRGEDRDQVYRGIGEERQVEAKEAVGPQLQQDAGKEHQARGRCLDVGVGKPGVEREERDLDGEGEGEGDEQPYLGGTAQLELEQVGVVERDRPGLRLVLEGEGDYPGEHERRPEGGVDKELDGGVDPTMAPPRSRS